MVDSISKISSATAQAVKQAQKDNISSKEVASKALEQSDLQLSDLNEEQAIALSQTVSSSFLKDSDLVLGYREGVSQAV